MENTLRDPSPATELHDLETELNDLDLERVAAAKEAGISIGSEPHGPSWGWGGRG
jgi:hypothetical protein